MAFVEFTAKFKERSVRVLRDTLTRAAGAATAIFARRRIENLVLDIHRKRFGAPGTSPFAQKTPDGVPWKQITNFAYGTRTNRGRRDQALVDTGELRDALRVIRGNLSTATQTGRAKAVVGIPFGDPAFEKGVINNLGLENEEGFLVPQREFIGFTNRDLSGLDRILANAARRIF